MNEEIKNEQSFVGYEYKDILVNRKMESEFSDGYVNFGWTLENISSTVRDRFSVMMKFKRDRRIRNKMELTRLQRQFEACITEIVSLERAKIIKASAVAYAIGILGTAFMAGSVFSYIAGMLVLSIILAIPALVGWVIPYFCFITIRDRKTVEINPLIDNKYDEIYEVCEKANMLLKNNL